MNLHYKRNSYTLPHSEAHKSSVIIEFNVYVMLPLVLFDLNMLL